MKLNESKNHQTICTQLTAHTTSGPGPWVESNLWQCQYVLDLVPNASNTRHQTEIAQQFVFFTAQPWPRTCERDAIIKTTLISPVKILTRASHNINTQHNAELARALMNNVRSFCEDSPANLINTIYGITMDACCSLGGNWKKTVLKSHQRIVCDKSVGSRGADLAVFTVISICLFPGQLVKS